MSLTIRARTAAAMVLASSLVLVFAPAHAGTAGDQPPVVTVTSTGNPAWQQDTSRTVTFTAVSADDLAITCSLDGAPAEPCSSPVALSDLAEGLHQLVVSATDSQQQVDTKTDYWHVDHTNPVVTFTAGPAEGAIDHDKTPTFSWATAPASDLWESVCDLDGHVDLCWPGFTRQVPAGMHTLTVTVTDRAGNSGSTTREWSVEPIPLSVTVTSGPDSNTIASRQPTFVYEATGEDHLDCSLDGAQKSICPSMTNAAGAHIYTTHALPNGPHSLVVTAVDELGPTIEVTRTWMVRATCTILVPRKVRIIDRSVPIVSRLAEDCSQAHRVHAGWGLVAADTEPVAGGRFVFDTSATTARAMLRGEVAPGRYVAIPSNASDAAQLSLDQNKAATSIRLGSRTMLFASRHGRTVRLTVGASRYSYFADAFGPWRQHAVQVQYRKCAACPWKDLRTVTTGATGRTTFSIIRPGVWFYRATSLDRPTTWGSASAAVLR